MKLNQHKAGFTLGLFFSGMHAVWSILVALGFAQTLMNWSLSLHMMSSNAISIAPFSLTNAVTLIIVTGIIGYVLGYAFATLWNKIHK